jgi:ankyrin repeat protein
LHDTETTKRRLEKACRSNDIEVAKICFLRGASLSEALPSGEFPLFIALKKQNFQFVEFLQQYGVDMNMRDKDGRGALHIAAANNDDEAICRLVELGAKRKLKDRKGQTALHAAAAAGHAKIVELLLELAAEINATDKAGWTAVSHAEFNDRFELADRLVKLGGSDPRGMRNETARKERKS